MNTRFCLLLLLTGFFSLSAIAQSETNVGPAVRSAIDEFIQASNNKEWNKVMDMMYPKLFSRTSKQDLIDMMVSLDQDGMSIVLSDFQIESVTRPVEEGNETFVRVDYVANMEVQLAKGGLFDAPKARTGIEQQFHAQYGKQNVKLDEATGAYIIRANKAMMAINQGDGQWKLIEINMDQPEIMEFVFSPSIMDALVRVE